MEKYWGSTLGFERIENTLHQKHPGPDQKGDADKNNSRETRVQSLAKKNGSPLVGFLRKSADENS